MRQDVMFDYLSFWERGHKVLFDLRVLYPNTCRYLNKSLQPCHVINESEKKRAYNERVLQIDHATFDFVKGVRIHSYSGAYFLALGPNTYIYSISLRIQLECGKMRTRITPNTDTFYAVFTPLVFSIYGSLGKECHKFYFRVSDLLSEKRNLPNPAVELLVCFELLKLSLLCLRAS